MSAGHLFFEERATPEVRYTILAPGDFNGRTVES
jgi:hypothetical protein